MDEDFDIPAAAEDEMNEDDFDMPDAFMKVGEEKALGKEGLKKKLLKEGHGFDTPDNGDEVEGNNIYTHWLCELYMFW